MQTRSRRMTVRSRRSSKVLPLNHARSNGSARKRSKPTKPLAHRKTGSGISETPDGWDRVGYQPIANYGIIGDLQTVSLVGIDGVIDFMCYPSFDSPSVFGALLDCKKGGSFKIAPVLNGANHKQLYLPESNVLLSRFLSHDGVGEISDFMPMCETGCSRLVRRAKAVRGTLRFRMICAPRFDYGRAEHRLQRKKSEAIFISRGKDKTAIQLRSEVPLKFHNGDAVAEFTLQEGQCAAFVLENANDSESPAQGDGYVSESFKRTLNFWQGWTRQSKYRGRWREMVNRSALTLKLLTSRRYGSIVAAPTFGLPEEIGGARNFDYRYTWIRDASFTLYALMRLGYTQEATAFTNWIADRCSELKPGKPLQIMYRLNGSHDLTEIALKHLDGYKGSKPVRIGNGAADQLQLDIYGELMDSIYIYNKFGELIAYDLWRNLEQLIDWVCDNWQRPDAGIWEIRGGPREFLYSRMMCWVAVDRGLRLAEKRSFPCPWEKWRATRDEIYKDIYENFWNQDLGCFVQFKGSTAVDAASLLMPLVRFIAPNDPRWRSTLKVINDQLVADSLVYRYNVLKGAATGFGGHEGTFSMCSFWNVECLARAGDLKQARLYFEKALGYANHLGLYAEELGLNGEHLGNFPQALTHLALISAAYYLDRKLGME